LELGSFSESVRDKEETRAPERLIGMASGRGRARELPPELIEACRRGEPDAFRALFEACKDGVYSIALHFSGSREAARDISQDVFLKLFHVIEGFRGESDFRSWLFRLVVNACIDERRRRRRFVSIEDDGAFPAGCPAAQETELPQKEIADQIRRAVLELSPKLRLPILLRYVSDLSYSEIAVVLRCSMGTVASRLNRGHRMLARRLGHLKGML
jgi:RNA polymerase sigma-70 factor (ECF subfamily)